MNLIALPAFADNYIWILHDGAQAVVVDPGDAAPVQAALDELDLALAGILVTHHHPDHVGGVDDLRPRLQGPVFGPARERIPQPCVPLRDGDAVEVPGLRCDAPDVVASALAQGAVDSEPPAVFTALREWKNRFR